MKSDKIAYSGEIQSSGDDFAQDCETLLSLFAESDDIVQAGRNTLKKIVFDGKECVMKAFRIPTFPQNFSYGMFAKSKAHKSFDNGNKLLEMGFFSPKPVGYFEYREGGKLKASYYVCEFAVGSRELRDLWNDQLEPSDSLAEQFAQFCVNLHKAGILHRDFNPGNVLISGPENKREFSLVDINRITWSGPLPLQKAMESLSRLPFSDQGKKTLIQLYASLAGVDQSRCEELLKQETLKTKRYFENKRKLRKIFPKK